MHPVPGNGYGRRIPNTGNPSNSKWSEWSFVDYDYNVGGWGDSKIPNVSTRMSPTVMP